MEDNFVYTNRYSLTQEFLNRIAADVKRNIGLDVYNIEETDTGYTFKGKYGVVIGDVTYLPNEGKYRRFNYHQGAKEEIENREKQVRRSNNGNSNAPRRRSRKFQLQRKRLGVALTASAIALLVLGGSIAIKTNAVENNPITSYGSEQINTVVSANDLILNSWLNYALGEVTNGASNSKYEHAQLVADDLKTNYFNSAFVHYYNYSDQIVSGLPHDVVGKLTDSYHNEFRNQCYIIDEALENSYFSYATFDESPYVDAVVFDQGGERVISNGLYGESYDCDGNLILSGGNVGYSVYVKAVDVPGNNYSITNLPADTKFINGETYVSDEHLDDFVNSHNRSR